MSVIVGEQSNEQMCDLSLSACLCLQKVADVLNLCQLTRPAEEM